MVNGLIVILVDGLGADYFAENRSHLPNLNTVAKTGCYVQRLGVDMSSLSMPGRTSIITGMPPAVHGIFDNRIWDGSRFRHANSRDIRVTSLARDARKAGLEVANMGFGMIAPDECDIFHAAYWSAEMLHKTDDGRPCLANEIWLEEMNAKVGFGRIKALAKRGFPDSLPDRVSNKEANYLSIGQTCDGILVDWSAGLATSDDAPDVIFTEIASPDYFLHKYGCQSDKTKQAIKRADAQVGRLLSCLRENGALHRFNIAIMSDHGFADIEESIHPDVILPGVETNCAGGVLHLRYNSLAQLDDVTLALSVHGVTALDNSHLPPEQRSEIAAFLAPAGCDFYPDYLQTGKARSASKYRATHGFAPECASDERFCLLMGPDVPKITLERATSGQLTPTLASLIGLQTDHYPAHGLF